MVTKRVPLCIDAIVPVPVPVLCCAASPATRTWVEAWLGTIEATNEQTQRDETNTLVDPVQTECLRCRGVSWLGHEPSGADDQPKGSKKSTQNRITTTQACVVVFGGCAHTPRRRSLGVARLALPREFLGSDNFMNKFNCFGRYNTELILSSNDIF